MLKQLHNLCPETSDTYEVAFVRTVLRLNGVCGTPTELQVQRAVDTFHRYCLVASQLRDRRAAIDDEWLNGQMPEPAAMEQAFLFVRFHSVMLPDAVEIRTFNEWLAAGTLH